jgi:hypothetical protein
MTLQDWGSIGELISAIAVVATLIYLTKQIRLNTIAMDEARKLALAQTYQMRSDALQAMMVAAADSDHIGPAIIKLTEYGYPEDLTALDRLTPDERGRIRLWQIAQQTHWDNMFFQYEHGYLDEESYQGSFKERVRRLAPTWRALNLMSVRKPFLDEIERLERTRPLHEPPDRSNR